MRADALEESERLAAEQMLLRVRLVPLQAERKPPLVAWERLQPELERREAWLAHLLR